MGVYVLFVFLTTIVFAGGLYYLLDWVLNDILALSYMFPSGGTWDFLAWMWKLIPFIIVVISSLWLFRVLQKKEYQRF